MFRMEETGWVAIGRVAKARRERLGLNQDELARHGGPKVATVGKFERAAQENFPLRTQHQIENALGWERGAIEDFVSAVDSGAMEDGHLAEWEHELIVENVPDMSGPAFDPDFLPDDEPVAGAISAIATLLRLVEPDRLDQAVREAVKAILPHLVVHGGADVGWQLRGELPAHEGVLTKQDVELVADDQEVSIAQEQEETERST